MFAQMTGADALRGLSGFVCPVAGALTSPDSPPLAENSSADSEFTSWLDGILAALCRFMLHLHLCRSLVRWPSSVPGKVTNSVPIRPNLPGCQISFAAWSIEAASESNIGRCRRKHRRFALHLLKFHAERTESGGGYTPIMLPQNQCGAQS